MSEQPIIENTEQTFEHGEEIGLDNEEYSDSESEEVETIDVTNEPMYHILSAFFEDEDGLNLVDRLSDLIKAVNKNTKTLNNVIKAVNKTSTIQTSTKQTST
jgi:hypothetical protein